MTNEMIQRWERLPDLVNEDARLVHKGRLVMLEALIGLGDLAYHLAIDRGPESGPLRRQRRTQHHHWRSA